MSGYCAVLLCDALFASSVGWPGGHCVSPALTDSTAYERGACMKSLCQISVQAWASALREVTRWSLLLR